MADDAQLDTLSYLRQWIGRTERVDEQISVSAVKRIHALLDYSAVEVEVGDIFPRGWHGVLCAPLARQSEIGADGHPQRGGFVPPIPFARRMAASNAMIFHDDLRVGDDVVRTSKIADLQIKKGQSGDLVFLTFEHEYSTARGIAVTETQNAVFRDVKQGREVSVAGKNADITPKWQTTVIADSVLIFRYAAIAFSGHRIHYDYLYGTQQEKYADVMVSGGLNLMLIFDLIRRSVDRSVTRFSSKNIRPLYAGEKLHVCAAPKGADGLHVWITDAAGTLAVRGEAELATR